MTEHFLDTEMRHLLPFTASVCVSAGLDQAQVRTLWSQDVAPVVGTNLLSPAGEWAGWDRAWLLRRIGERRRRQCTRWGRWRNRWSRWMQPGNQGDLEALGRFVIVLMESPDATARDRMLADLQWLARCFFAMPIDASSPALADRQRLLHCYETRFQSAMAPAVRDSESAVGEQRVRVMLASHG